MKLIGRLDRKQERRRVLWMVGLFLLACYLYVLDQQDGIREAAIRGEIADWHIGNHNASLPAAVFVSVENDDASDSLLVRFRGEHPVVYKGSPGDHVSTGDRYRQYWVNPTTGLRGGHISLDHIVWTGPFTARVNVNYPLAGYTSTVVKSFSGWKVVKREMGWES